ncbi:MAG: ATP-binding protein [Candidatus Pacearchaeota archaeon]|jgi:hypothetical protein
MNSNIEKFGTRVRERLKDSQELMAVRSSSPKPMVINKSLTDTLGCNEDNTDNRVYQQYIQIDRNTYYIVRKTVPIMPSGFYGVAYAEPPIDFIFVKTEITQDDFIPMEGYIVKDVMNDIDTFWDCSSSFEKYGFIHKRGILLFGPAGGGKTVAVQEICKKVISNGGIIFSFTSGGVECNVFGKALSRFRIVEPDRPVVCIFEDIDAIIEKYGESELLQLLDGGIQIDKVLMLATSNYPERLDRRIISRPRRFDRIIFIDTPPAFARRKFFEGKLKGVSDGIIDTYVEATDGLSFAALSELIVSVHCLGNDFKSSIELLKDLMKHSYNSNNFKKSYVGFEKQ